MSLCLAFPVHAGNLNEGPHISVAGTLSTEPSPCPLAHFISFLSSCSEQIPDNKQLKGQQFYFDPWFKRSQPTTEGRHSGN